MTFHKSCLFTSTMASFGQSSSMSVYTIESVSYKMIKDIVENILESQYPTYHHNRRYSRTFVFTPAGDILLLVYLVRHQDRYKEKILVSTHKAENESECQEFALKNGLDQCCQEIFEFCLRKKLCY